MLRKITGQRGFAILDLVLLIFVLLFVGAAFLFIYHRRHSSQAGTLSVNSISCSGPMHSSTQNDLLVTQDIKFADSSSGSICFDVYRKNDSNLRPVVVAIHGGGNWIPGQGIDHGAGSKSLLISQAQALAEAGFVVVNADWRQYPPYHFPDSYGDIRAVISYIRDTAHSTYNMDNSRIGIFGTSAGGVLAGYAATQNLPGVKAAVTWSGSFNFVINSPTRGQQALLSRMFNCTNCSIIKQYSALYQVGPSTAPMAIFGSQNELINVSQPKDMAEALNKAGVANQLTLYLGSRHATQYSVDAMSPTIEWFNKWL